MWRRFVYTLVGALVGYLVGAMIGTTAFTAINGFKSISILEEANRNRWTFVAASAGAVLGGLIAWWRSYSDGTPSDDRRDETGDGEERSGQDQVNDAER